MSTPDNPEFGQLTRRQMRQIRTTASTPVIGADTAVATREPPSPPLLPLPKAPLPRAARPVSVAPAPGPDAAVDLGVVPLTRRQARQQERIRTASVPVITPEMAAGHAASAFAPPAVSPGPAPVTAEVVMDDTPETGTPAAHGASGERGIAVDDEPAPAPESAADPTPPAEASPQVHSRLGANLLAVQEPAGVENVSFDELLTRNSGAAGSVATPHALILNHVPEASALSAVTSTGEVIVTGIYNLPEGLGSQGHAVGTADGKEIDATLIDGELAASSSPTPIAASAAISTVRGSGDIIRPPAPERSNRLVMILAIAAAAALVVAVGLLVFALGVFN